MTDEITQQYLKSIIESILFISEKPVTLEQMKEVMDNVGASDIRKLLAEMMQEYEGTNRGMIITEIAGGYQMLSNPRYASHVRNFFKKRVKEKLSKPALETLAIVAYKQPVSRGDVELIRGVNSDGVITHLQDKALIKIVGRRDVPGRPYLYGTTKIFLEYFGLKSLQDMPKLEEFPALYDQGQQRDESGDLIHRSKPEDMMAHAPSEQEQASGEPGIVDKNAPAGEAVQPGTDIQEPKEAAVQEQEEDIHKQESEVSQDKEITEIDEGSDTDPGPQGSETASVPDEEDPGIEDASDLKKAMDDINREERVANTSAPEDQD